MIKKALSLVLSIICFAACTPRDVEDALGSNSRNNVKLKSGEVVRVSGEGQKLPSCTGEGKPTWGQIRYFSSDLDFISPKIEKNEVSIFVGKGDTCLQVSSEKPVEYSVKKSRESDWESTGVRVYVKKIHMMPTKDLLGRSDLLSEYAEGMGMTINEMISYLKAKPNKDVVHILFLSKAAKVPVKTLQPGEIEVVDTEDGKLESCSAEGKPTWGQIRLFHDLDFIFEKALNNELTTVVSKGDTCLKVSSKTPVEYSLKKTAADPWEVTGTQAYIYKMELMRKEDLLSRTDLLASYSQGMGMTEAELVDYLNSPPTKDLVSVVHLSKDPKAPAGGEGPKDDSEDDDSSSEEESSLTILKMPEDIGKTASDCNSKWTDIRIFNGIKEEVLSGITDQSLKVYVSQGDRSCLAVGEAAQFVSKDDQGNFVVVENSGFIVQSVVVRNRSDLTLDPILSSYVAEDMGMNLEDFTNFIGGMSKDKINMTYIQWEKEEDGQ